MSSNSLSSSTSAMNDNTSSSSTNISSRKSSTTSSTFTPASPSAALSSPGAASSSSSRMIRSSNGNLVRTREWHQIKSFHQYLMVRPHQNEWKGLIHSKAKWIAEMKKPNPELTHQRAIELFGDYFERVGTDAWRVRFNRRSASPHEWIPVDFFSKGRALDPFFLRFLMSVTWAMKTPAFQAKVPRDEFLRDRTEEEDKAAKDTFLLAHRFLYDSCLQGLRLDMKQVTSPEGRALLKEWQSRGLVDGNIDGTGSITLARDTLDLFTYDNPLLPTVLEALVAQRPDAHDNYHRIIDREAKSRTCFFRRYKEAKFLALFGPPSAALLASFDDPLANASPVPRRTTTSNSTNSQRTPTKKRQISAASRYSPSSYDGSTFTSPSAYHRPRRARRRPALKAYKFECDDEGQYAQEQENFGRPFQTLKPETWTWIQPAEIVYDDGDGKSNGSNSSNGDDDDSNNDKNSGSHKDSDWRTDLEKLLTRWFPQDKLFEEADDPRDPFDKWCSDNQLTVKTGTQQHEDMEDNNDHQHDMVVTATPPPLPFPPVLVDEFAAIDDQHEQQHEQQGCEEAKGQDQIDLQSELKWNAQAPSLHHLIEGEETMVTSFSSNNSSHLSTTDRSHVFDTEGGDMSSISLSNISSSF